MITVQQLKDAAKVVYADKPVLQRLVVAQGILESGLSATHISKLAEEGKNLFGIKYNGIGNFLELPTTEYINGKKVIVNAKFQKFNSYSDCFMWHRQLMQKPRYQSVWNAATIEEACTNIQKDGYATDPNYTKLLLSIIKRESL